MKKPNDEHKGIDSFDDLPTSLETPLRQFSLSDTTALPLPLADDDEDDDSLTERGFFTPPTDFDEEDPETIAGSFYPHHTPSELTSNTAEDSTLSDSERWHEAPSAKTSLDIPVPLTPMVEQDLKSTTLKEQMVLGAGALALAEATREFRFVNGQLEFKLIGQTFGNFQIAEQIGQGGFGSVYRARHIQLDREVAIKVLRVSEQTQPKVIERFHREAQAMSGLDHENIVQFYDFGELPGVGFYLMMEFLHGEGLDQHMGQSKLWPLKKISQVMGALCDALHCVHQKGIVHRDMKPSNIMVLEEGGQTTAKLLDFGIATRMGADSRLTRPGAFLGTAQYIAPEQAKGRKDIDGRADLYSLGVVLFRLLTGELPFDATSKMDIVIKHLHQQIPLLSEVAPWRAWCESLELFMQMALAKEADKRPADALLFKELCVQALEVQNNSEREGRTVVDPKAKLASTGELAAFVAEHGEMPHAGSHTMRLDLASESDESLRKLLNLDEGKGFQWRTFWVAFGAVLLSILLLWWVFR